MDENDRNLRSQPSRFCLLCFAAGLVLTVVMGSAAQVDSCKNAEALELSRLGAKQVDPSCRKFEVEGAILILSYKASTLATIEVESKEGQPKVKYERLVGIAKHLKSLGTFVRGRPISTVGPSGWTSRVSEYSRAYIVRNEQTCSGAKAECGVKKFAVFYWVPLAGRITAKRIDEVAVKGFTKEVSCYVTVDGSEVRVSKSDYRRLKKGQAVNLEATLSNDLARIASRPRL